MVDQAAQTTVRLRLKKREERRLEFGHLWIFSNEIDTSVTLLKGLPAGCSAIVESASGKFLGHAYVNPASLISARITSRNKAQPFNAALLHERLSDALSLRQARYTDPFYRLVHSEGDFLPGLVVDRFGDVLVVQITTAGMEQYRDDIVEALVDLTHASAICLQNNTPIRDLEQLPSYVEWVHGSAVQQLVIKENDLDFAVPFDSGQKTGWFFDHRDSRFALRNWCAGKRVLDLYSYIGGFGINAAVSGASAVVSVDASDVACSAVRDNARRNKVADLIEVRCDDAVEAMREMFKNNQRFDVIVLDPPAFIKRKKDRDAGARHYALNNRLAVKLLNPGGILLSASCSQAFSLESLQQAVSTAVQRGRPGVQFLDVFQQASDHPVNSSMPESLYLKGVIARFP